MRNGSLLPFERFFHNSEKGIFYMGLKLAIADHSFDVDFDIIIIFFLGVLIVPLCGKTMCAARKNCSRPKILR